MTDIPDMTTRRHFIVGFAPSLGLAGCSGLLAPPPPALYELTPKSTFDADLPDVKWHLLIDPVTAPSSLDTERITISEGPVRVDYYAGVEWTERSTEMVYTLLVESFENTGRIISIGRQNRSLRADFLLQPELREFRTERWPGEPYRVRVTVNVKLVRLPDRVIIDNTRSESVMPIPPGASFPQLIEVWDEALGAVMRQIVEWTLRTGQAEIGTRSRLGTR
jgi:cholesterol transport system auxiliary component